VNDEKLWPVKCEKCGHNRWRTKVVHREYECRNCGFVRKKKI